VAGRHGARGVSLRRVQQAAVERQLEDKVIRGG